MEIVAAEDAARHGVLSDDGGHLAHHGEGGGVTISLSRGQSEAKLASEGRGPVRHQGVPLQKYGFLQSSAPGAEIPRMVI